MTNNEINEQKQIKQELAALQKKANKIWNWLIDNIDSPNWREVKQNYNALKIKIENRRQRLASSGQLPDYSRVQQLPDQLNR